MIPFIVGGAVFSLFLLLLYMRLKLVFRYEEELAKVTVKLGPFHVLVFPRPPKKFEEKTQKKKPKKEGKVPKDRSKISLELIREILSLALKEGGRFQKKLRIDLLELDLILGSEDPADAALYYGYANAVFGTLLPWLEVYFNLKKKSVRVALDYELDKPKLVVQASCSLTVRQMLMLGLHAGIQGIGLYRKVRKQKKTLNKAV